MFAASRQGVTEAAVVFPAHADVIKTCEQDNRILECALDAEVDALITGDRTDILPLREFRGIRIVAPREFLESLEA